ncbi:MAG: hypothetical protein ABI614_08535 [Planctomycetota bacterium]
MRWIDEVRNKRFNFEPANRVWRQFVQSEEFLRALFVPIERNQQQSTANLHERIDFWRQRQNIISKIKEADERTSRKFSTHIDGDALERLISSSFDGAELCAAWYHAVEAKRDSESPQDWTAKQVSELRRALKNLLPKVQIELEELQCTENALQIVAADFALESCTLLGTMVAAENHCENSQSTEGISDYLAGLEPRGLWPALRRRLWCLADVHLDDAGGPLAEEIPTLASALEQSNSEESSLESVFRQKVENQDFRHTDEMLVLLRDSVFYDELEKSCQEAFRTATHQLLARIEELDSHIQNAVIDGTLVEEYRIDFQNQLRWIKEAQPQEFRLHREKLEVIRRTLEDLRDEHLLSQHVTWETERDDLLSLLEGDQKQSVVERMSEAFSSREPRVVQELLSQLQVAHSRREMPDLSDLRPGRNLLEDFRGQHETLAEIARDWRIDLLDMADSVVVVALNCWNELRKMKVASDDPQLTTVLSFLGLSTVKTKSSIQVTGKKDQEWIHVTANVTDSGFSPVPQYGSLREQSYDILIVRALSSGSPTIAITSALKNASLQRRPTLVLYLGILLNEQRMNMARRFRSDSVPAVVLDDTLLLWLAQQNEHRWPTFLRAALPFAFVSPYAPTGSVPREMFFGRERMLNAVLDFEGSGSSIVYGGRQLGKTALLHRARREFHSVDGTVTSACQGGLCWTEQRPTIPLLSESTVRSSGQTHRSRAVGTGLGFSLDYAADVRYRLPF